MPHDWLHIPRPVIFGPSELAAIETGALRILEEVGIEIGEPGLAARFRGSNMWTSGGRVRFSTREVSAFLTETRSAHAHNRDERLQPTETPALTLHVSQYPQNVHDPETGDIVPMTQARLREETKLVDMLATRGLASAVAGCPTDVPPPLQPLLQYQIGAETLRGGTPPVDAKSLETLPYVMEMAEVLGQPIRGLPVYVFSPLRLAGESLLAVMRFASRLREVSVHSMPAAGCTAPVHPIDAFSLAAAEVIGAALVLRECLGLDIHWAVSVYPFDLRGMSMSFGSPESVLFELASREVNAHLHGSREWSGYGNIHTLAKEPGAQAAAEKMSSMALLALWGDRDFLGAGALGMDEVFSRVQLLLDLEMRDHVQRLSRGLDTNHDLEDLLAEVAAAMGCGFAASDATLDHYQALYWHPRLFERRFLGPWLMAGRPSLAERTRETAARLVAQHSYELAPELRAELDRIYKKAERELGTR